MEGKSDRFSLFFVPAAFLFVILIPALSFLVSVHVDEFFHWTEIAINPFLRILVSAPFLLLGSYLAILSNVHLYRTGKGYLWGDARTSDETGVLVTDGPYRYTRNPMVLGYAIILSSLGIAMGSITLSLILPPTLLTLISLWIKLGEEPALERRFGKAYLDYKERIPFLIPRLKKRGIDE